LLWGGKVTREYCSGEINVALGRQCCSISEGILLWGDKCCSGEAMLLYIALGKQMLNVNVALKLEMKCVEMR